MLYFCGSTSSACLKNSVKAFSSNFVSALQVGANVSFLGLHVCVKPVVTVVHFFLWFVSFVFVPLLVFRFIQSRFSTVLRHFELIRLLISACLSRRNLEDMFRFDSFKCLWWERDVHFVFLTSNASLHFRLIWKPSLSVDSAVGDEKSIF